MIIGIGHKKRRGKDSAANRLVDKHKFIRISWADSLKDAARIIFHFDDEQLFGTKKELVDSRWGFSPRWALQALGTEACRNNIDDNIWIKSAWLRIEDILKKHPKSNFVIPDVRFENEANFLLEKGAVLWRIDRDIPPDGFSEHSSETALDNFSKWTHVINNNNSLQDLYTKVDQLVLPQEIKHVYNTRKIKTN
jgi:hypothetical protein